MCVDGPFFDLVHHTVGKSKKTGSKSLLELAHIVNQKGDGVSITVGVSVVHEPLSNTDSHNVLVE